MQAGRIWNAFLVEKLREIGFEPSLVDNCMFYHNDVIFIVYVEDGIFLGPSSDTRSTAINKDQGHPANDIGFGYPIKRLGDGSIELAQLVLIDSIIEYAALEDNCLKMVPAMVKENIHAHKDKP